MDDSERRRPWNEGPDEDAAPESWLLLDDDELLLRIETLDPAGDEDDRLLEVVTSDRHFFIRQEAAKRVNERRLPRAAVRDLATWMVVFRKAVQSAAPDGSLHSVRASTSLMADALRAAGFDAACDELETALRA